MTEKRYFSIDYDEEYYIFDSTKISKEEVLEKAEYSYDVFGDSLMEDDVVNLLNENERLKSEIEKLSYANEDLLNEKRNWSKMSDEYAKLYQENEQLKKERLTWLKSQEELECLSAENKQLESEYNILKAQFLDLNKFVENNFDEYLTQEKLNKRIKELETKLNETAFELLNNEIISMGKAVEISEMSYHDFIVYRAEKGNPMELQL